MGSLSDNERYLISLQEKEEQRETGNTEIPISDAPKRVKDQIRRQIRYRRARELSMSRDQPPRLPCRPWYDNEKEFRWLRTGETEKEYHQKRVDDVYHPPFHGVERHRKCIVNEFTS